MTIDFEPVAASPSERNQPTVPRVDVELQHEIEQFLYFEAQLQADREYRDWLDLFAEDIHYWMPTRYNRLRRELHREFSEADETAFFDEDYDSLSRRITRIETGMAWAEDPPSRTRHLVTNVVARHVDAEEHTGFTTDDLEVRSAFLVYRNRLEREENIFAGCRTDILRRTPDGYDIARRTILLDQNILLSKNISTFF